MKSFQLVLRKRLICLTEPFTPIAGSPLGMHHCNDPHALGFVQINHGVRKAPGQCTTGRRTEFKESRRLTPNFLDEPFDFLVKTGAKLWPYIRVISDRLNVFLSRFRVEDVRFHRPAIFATSLDTSSPGIP